MSISEDNAESVCGEVVMKWYGRADGGSDSYGKTPEMAYTPFLEKKVGRIVHDVFPKAIDP